MHPAIVEGVSLMAKECQKCGAVMSDNQKKCPSCGARQRRGVHAHSCPQCGGSLDSGERMCQNCGYQLRRGYSTASVPQVFPTPDISADRPAATSQPTQSGENADWPYKPQGNYRKPNSSWLGIVLMATIGGLLLIGFFAYIANSTSDDYSGEYEFQDEWEESYVQEEADFNAGLEDYLQHSDFDLWAIERGEAQIYNLQYVYDNSFSKSALQILLPEGWQLDAKTQWDTQSFASPYTSQLIIHPNMEGAPRADILSPRYYTAPGSLTFYAETQVVVSAEDWVNYFFESIYDGFYENLRFSVKDEKADAALQQAWEAEIEPYFALLRERGYQIQVQRFSLHSVSGTITGADPAQELVAEMALCHFTLTKDGQTDQYYGVPFFHLYVADEGYLSNYLADFRTIAANVRTHPDLSALSKRVTQEALQVMEENDFLFFEDLYVEEEFSNQFHDSAWEYAFSWHAFPESKDLRFAVNEWTARNHALTKYSLGDTNNNSVYLPKWAYIWSNAERSIVTQNDDNPPETILYDPYEWTRISD